MQGFLITQQSCILSATLLFLGVLKKLTHSIIPFESKAMIKGGRKNETGNFKPISGIQRWKEWPLIFQIHFWNCNPLLLESKSLDVKDLSFLL
jgi:hypothetical protein